MRNRWVLGAILLGCLALAVGCGRDNDGGGDQETGPSLTPTAQPAPPFTVDDVIWTTGVNESTGVPLDQADAYTTISPAVVAVVPARNVPAGTEFTATWTIDDLDVPEANMSVTVEQDMSTAWVAFEFVRDDDRYFPLGTLEVTVTASSGETVDGSVEIGLP